MSPTAHLNDRCQHVIKIHNKYVIMKLTRMPCHLEGCDYDIRALLNCFLQGYVKLRAFIKPKKNHSVEQDNVVDTRPLRAQEAF